MSKFLGAAAPSTDVMLSRLLLTVIPIAGIALIGWGLKTDDSFRWYTTFITFWVLFSFQLGRVWPQVGSMSPAETRLYEWAAPLRESFAEVPILRLLSSPSALKTIGAGLLAILPATAEQPISIWFSRFMPEGVSDTVSLFLILAALYFLEKLYQGSRTHPPTTWGAAAFAALLQMFRVKSARLGKVPTAIIVAVGRSALGVVIRLSVSLFIPILFFNEAATAGFALLLIALIIASDFYFPAGREAGRLVRPEVEDRENPNSKAG